MKKWFKYIATVATVAVLSALFVAPAPAQASSCYTPWCGGYILNNAPTGTVFAANNWCWSSSADYYGSSLPCATTFSDGLPNAYIYMPPGRRTVDFYYYYDTDAIGIDPGCFVQFNGNFIIDNRYSPQRLWRKLYNTSGVNINLIIC